MTAGPTDGPGDGAAPQLHRDEPSRRLRGACRPATVRPDSATHRRPRSSGGSEGRKRVVRGSGDPGHRPRSCSSPPCSDRHGDRGGHHPVGVGRWPIPTPRPRRAGFRCGMTRAIRAGDLPATRPLQGADSSPDRARRCRSNDAPISIAPWIDPVSGPVIAPVAGLFTCKVAGVPTTGAELRLGAVRLARTSSGCAGTRRVARQRIDRGSRRQADLVLAPGPPQRPP